MDYPSFEGVDIVLSEHVLTVRRDRPDQNNAFTTDHANYFGATPGFWNPVPAH
jgi:hypothetical protein